MSVLAIKKATFDGLSEQKQDLVRFALRELQLGRPAVYKAGASTLWYVFSDPRISLKDVARIGRLGANLNNFPLDVIDDEGWSGDQTRGYLLGWMDRDGIVLVGTPDADDPWQDILDLNGAPAAIRAADSVPDTWTPQPEEPAP